MRLAFTISLLTACATGACSSAPNDPSPGGAKSAPETAVVDAAAGHLLVQLRSGQGRLDVVQVTPVKSALPTLRGAARAGRWSALAYSGTQQLVHNVNLADPRSVRGEFQDPLTGEQQHVHFTKTDTVDFAVRVPVNTARIDLFGRSDNRRSAEPLGSVNLPTR